MKHLFMAASGAMLLTTSPLGAQTEGDPFYCDERKLGHWFYCDEPEVEDVDVSTPPPSLPARVRLEAIQTELEELKAQAILDPTTENITRYVAFQRQQLDRASMFADVWQRSLWQNPDLDYTLERPVSNLAKRTWQNVRTSERDAMMDALTQRYGVFYFYSSSCPACQTFSPVMRALADRFGLEVLAVSMDGGPTPGFPDFAVNQGQYHRMGLEGGTVPAIVLFDTVTKKPVPIGYGVMSADEVIERIFYLTQTEPGGDY